MKYVICVYSGTRYNNPNKPPITEDFRYEVFDEMRIPFSRSRPDDYSGPFYKIKGDNGEERWIDKDRFRDLTISEERELKLESIGI